MENNANVVSTDFQRMSSRNKCLHSTAKRTNSVRCRTENLRQSVLEILRKSAQRFFYKDNFPKSSHVRHCGTKTAFTKTLFFTSMIFFIISQDRLRTLAAVARVPEFISLSGALEGSRCDVREEIVNVRHEHPSLPPNAFYSPSCVKLNRCSGCCESDSMRCVPTSEYTTRIEISERITFPRFSYKILTMEFTHHGSCECRSRDETRPVCVQKACETQETWDAEECRCIPTPDVTCIEKTCGQGQQWNGVTCQCEASCQRRVCANGQRWNEETCNCEAICRNERCPPGRKFDFQTCSCTLKCPARTCVAGEIWNPVTCSCHCRPCHHRRIIHRRLGGNTLRCLCRPICKFERRKRALCESRRRIFIPETCSCRSRTSPFGR